MKAEMVEHLRSKRKEFVGFVNGSFLEKGWRGTDGAVFVYRRRNKDPHLVRVVVTPKTKQP